MFKGLKHLKRLNFVKILDLAKVERQLIYGISIVLFIIANLLVSSFSFRYDASYGNAYTLSSSTKKVLKNLDDVVNIKFYVSSDIPTRLIPLKTDVVDLLNEYKKEGRGKMRTKILDPKKDLQALNEAKTAGIPELQFSQLEQDKYAVSSSFFGIALSYGDKKEILPQVTELDSLEYNLTAAIYKMTKKELVKIGIIGREEVFDPSQNPLASFIQTASKQFTIEYVDATVSATKKLDTSYKTLLVFDTGVKEFGSQEIEALKNYFTQKGKAIFFVDGVWVQDNLTTLPAKHNQSALLSEYGIKIQSNLALSTAAELVNFGNDQVSFLAPYPFWLKTGNFDLKSSYFSNIGQLTYPWVSSISLEKKGGMEAKPLVWSTKQSWEQKDSFVLSPQDVPQPQEKDLKQFIITAESKARNGAHIVVVPSSRFILDRYISRGSGNLEFVINLLNDMASDGALSGIRQRIVNFYPVPDLPEPEKDIFKYANILVLPMTFALFGILRLLKRR